MTIFREDLPVGSVVIWAGDSTELPENWKVCEGQALSKHDFEELFHVLGNRWDKAVPDEPEDEDADLRFHLPDLRGVFLRGVNGNRADDYCDPDVDQANPDIARKRLKPGLAFSLNDAGSYQKCEVQIHSHALELSQSVGRHIPGENDRGPDGSNWGYKTKDVGIAKTGGNETRPVNAYVYFIIKVSKR